MKELDRDIALALLKRLKERELIGDEAYLSACNSRFFNSKNFADYSAHQKTSREKGAQNNEY